MEFGLSEEQVLLQDIRTLPPPRYSDEQWAVLLALFRLLPMAVAELQRCIGELGMRGVEISTRVNNEELSSPRLRPSVSRSASPPRIC